MEDAVRGVSIMNSVSQAGFLAGPALGGVAIAVVGVALTYAALAALLAVATGCLVFIERRPVPERAEDEPIGRSLLGGRALRHPDAGAPGLDGAGPVRGVLRRGRRAPADLRGGRPPCRAGGPGRAADRTVGRGAGGDARRGALAAGPARGPDAAAAVAGFGISVIVFGLDGVRGLGAGAPRGGITDGVSMVIRSTILRVLSPERIRGRVAAVNWVFIGASNELGAFESGVAARLFGAVPAVVAAAC